MLRIYSHYIHRANKIQQKHFLLVTVISRYMHLSDKCLTTFLCTVHMKQRPYMYIHTYIYMYVCMYVCVTRMHACMCVHVRIYVCVC